MRENTKTDNTKFLYCVIGLQIATIIIMLTWFLIAWVGRNYTIQAKNSVSAATVAEMSSKVDKIPKIITAQQANKIVLAEMKSHAGKIPEPILTQNANTTTLAAMKFQVDMIPGIITTQLENSKLLARIDERTLLMGEEIGDIREDVDEIQEDIAEIRKGVDILQSQNLEHSELLNSILQLLQNPDAESNLQNKLTQSPN